MATGDSLELIEAPAGEAFSVVLEAGGADQLVVPGGAFLLVAEYVREGPDLLLIGGDGAQVLIRDYFATESPPDLLSAGGAVIPAELAAKLAGPEAPGQYAQAAGEEEAQPIGRVETVEGEVVAGRADGTQETLAAGSPIFIGDVLETSAGSSIGIVFIDNTTFSLGEDARMVIDDLVLDPSTNEGNSSFSVVQGVFTFVSGQIAASGPDHMIVQTPVATIGIRGTRVAGVAAAEGEANTITLLAEEGGVVGEISISNSAGTVVLNVANQSLQVTCFFQAPGQPVILSNDQVNALFGQALAALPEQPAAPEQAGEAAAAEGEGEAEGEEEEVS